MVWSAHAGQGEGFTNLWRSATRQFGNHISDPCLSLATPFIIFHYATYDLVPATNCKYGSAGTQRTRVAWWLQSFSFHSAIGTPDSSRHSKINYQRMEGKGPIAASDWNYITVEDPQSSTTLRNSITAGWDLYCGNTYLRCKEACDKFIC